METVFCECKKCDAPIGRFANLWTQIGKSYFSPVVEPDDDLAVQPRGEVRIGDQGTLVEECHLQDIVCGNCAASIALRCIQTPVNHVLDENQLLLRLAAVEFLNSEGEEIEFSIKRVLNVNEPSKVNKAKFPDPTQGQGFTSTFPGAVEIQQLQIDLHTQREDIKRIDSNGYRIVSALDKRSTRIEGDVTKLKDNLGGVQRDVESSQHDLALARAETAKVKTLAQDIAALQGLDARLSAATAALGEVQQQVVALSERTKQETSQLMSELEQQKQDMEDLRSEITNGVVAAAEYHQDMASLRAEVAHLRQQLAETRAHGAGRVETAFPPRELEVLTSNIAKIGNRASQVETLQMELEILKGRVERAETSRHNIDDRQPTRTVDTGGSRYPENFPNLRKRAASPGVEPLPKRPVSSAGYSDYLSSGYATPPAWPANPPTATSNGITPEDDGSRAANSAKRGRKLPRGRPASSSTGVSTRSRRQ